MSADAPVLRVPLDLIVLLLSHPDNAGHLLEAAMSHYRYTKERRFLDAMIKVSWQSTRRVLHTFSRFCPLRLQNVECFSRAFGPGSHQLHGYPGHPELELAVLRLYSMTKDPSHMAFGQYLLAARGVKQEDQDAASYFPYEARVRQDDGVPGTMGSIDDQS